MILNPYKQRQIIFYDWDDTVIGVLCLPEILHDVRAFANFFVGVNLIHPDVSGGIVDEWAEEREERYAQAIRDWPRRAIYPEESWWFESGADGPVMRHSLRYLPAGYVPERSSLTSFRPKRSEAGK
ncbi:hypothetical protein [Vermiculatibacterium agrestimuris]|uniref:hypothetical protein n=1 Tax=Vermiculatibacterium agrestimuris TaxID=2941519 RepID=UPI00203FEAF4|nr:hypothetical protein [Vermiculatibacterium agrestimuris]